MAGRVQQDSYAERLRAEIRAAPRRTARDCSAETDATVLLRKHHSEPPSPGRFRVPRALHEDAFWTGALTPSSASTPGTPQDSFAPGANAGSFSRLLRTASAPYSNICRS